jgi:hypothetical protein
MQELLEALLSTRDEHQHQHDITPFARWLVLTTTILEEGSKKSLRMISAIAEAQTKTYAPRARRQGISIHRIA